MTETPDPIDRARLTDIYPCDSDINRTCRDNWPESPESWCTGCAVQWLAGLADAAEASRDDLAGQVARLTEELQAQRDYDPDDLPSVEHLGTPVMVRRVRVSSVVRGEPSLPVVDVSDDESGEAATLRGEVARLTQALEKFGMHRALCPQARGIQFRTDDPCDCGLAAALRGATEERTT